MAIIGASGDDTLTGGGGDDIIAGLDGDDLLSGGDGRDQINGGLGADLINGENGDDVLRGGKGNDTLSGGGNDDVLYGGAGDDVLVGGRSFDVFSGDDTLVGGKGADQFYGGLGTTTVSYADSRAGVSVDLPANECHGGDAEGDQFFDSAGGVLIGSGFADTLIGAGNMDGGEGDDRLVAEWGTWSVTGGAGEDVFGFTWNKEIIFNHPLVTDFAQGQDMLDLSAIDPHGQDGDQAFRFIGTAAFSGKAGEVRYEVSGGQTVIQLNMDKDVDPEHVITLDGVFTLTGADFVL
jgi:Ca2+-binding RTX toxin-like protein